MNERERQLKRKNYALLFFLLALMAIFYAVTIVKFGVRGGEGRGNEEMKK